mgnify:CR=1 FL=1
MEKITDQNFDKLIKDYKIVVVKFGAEWCSPCRIIKPLLGDISKEFDKTDIIFGDVNIDENSEISSRFGIRSIPTVMFFKNGELVDKVVGLHSKDDYLGKINQHLS